MRFACRPLALAASALMLQLTAGTTFADPGRELAAPLDLPLQAGLGPAQLSANLFFERSAAEPEGAPAGPLRYGPLRYQWQLRHRWKPLMSFGLQGFGEVGRWADRPAVSEPSHRAGPALFGRWDLGRGADEALLYQAAYLLGRVYRRQGDLFTVRLQYSF